MSADAPPRYARVALSGAVYGIDRPYTYLVPESLSERAAPGVRVIVPFGRGNRRREGFLLALSDDAGPRDSAAVKSLSAVLDDAPVLDAEGIRLAMWLTERCYCTFFEAFRAMVPTGLHYTFSAPSGGGALTRAEDFAEFSAKRRVSDKTETIVTLCVPPEEAAAQAASKGRGASMQRAALELLSELHSAASQDICYFTGCSRRTLRALERQGLVELTEQEAFRPPAGYDGPPQNADDLVLTDEQQNAYAELAALLDADRPQCALLHGVTGSGKTLVYVKLIARVLAQGDSAMVLVPEIALTPQLMQRFTALFGDKVALLHSGLTAAQRLDEWKRLKQGVAALAVGARSAVFAPLPRLKLIILDEEHEGTYKSDAAPRYHAQDVAKYRAHRENALLVLGSATPGMESMYAARTGAYAYLPLRQRYNRGSLPAVTIADLREDLREGFDGTVGSVLREELRRNLENGEQSILFLNRRGYNRQWVCGDCGEAPGCPRCSVPLTYHAANDRLMCHFCGHSEPSYALCPLCGGRLRPLGAGTQRVAEELEELFPGVGVLRMDSDTAAGRDGHRKLLHRFGAENIPMMVGTQMVAKGLDFPNVTLVGVISADAMLRQDDYRASERTFSLLTQVTGRAGRAGKPGRAVLQTLCPAHPVLQFAARQDYGGFFESELALRKAQRTPPFSELLKFSVFGLFADTVRDAAHRLRRQLDAAFRAQGLDARVYGPAQAGVMRVNNLYRYQLVISGANTPPLRHILSETLRAFPGDKRHRGVHAYADPRPSGF